MTDKLKILAISGSTRKSSSNLNLIKAIADLSLGSFVISIFKGLTELPHFNPDLDNENVPYPVTDFRRFPKEIWKLKKLKCRPQQIRSKPILTVILLFCTLKKINNTNFFKIFLRH